MMHYNHPLLLVFFIIFCFAFLIEVFYYLYFYFSVAKFIHPELTNKKPPVSVIICARNEEKNLSEFLPAVLEQDYPEYEVIVVNDCSEDDSYIVLGEFLKKYTHLKVSNINRDPKFTHNKKFAQLIGIKAAKNEILLFTDADCRPESDKWLALMVSRFEEKIDFVLGYGGYMRNKGLLNSYLRYDTMFIAMQYMGMTLRGIPYMGVGRNLAYRRSLFFQKKGFGGHTHLASGDDDLFVNANATRENTAIEFRKDSQTRSVPSSGFKEFFRQKSRHLTTARYYKLSDKMILAIEPVARIIFYSALVILLSSLYLWPFATGLFGFRLIIQLIIFMVVRERLNEKGILPLIPIFDILSPFINLMIYVSSRKQETSKNLWN